MKKTTLAITAGVYFYNLITLILTIFADRQ